MMIDELVFNFVLTQDIVRNSKKASRLAHHLGRCKKGSDKMKLTAMIGAYMVSTERSLAALVENTVSVKNSLLTPVRYG